MTDLYEIRANYDMDTIAEEAFATCLFCFLTYVDKPLKALNRAAVTCGDSNSIGCLTGLAGAYHGVEVWPKEWIERIEYNERIRLYFNRA